LNIPFRPASYGCKSVYPQVQILSFELAVLKTLIFSQKNQSHETSAIPLIKENSQQHKNTPPEIGFSHDHKTLSWMA
jgi:hypothetical protein